MKSFTLSTQAVDDKHEITKSYVDELHGKNKKNSR